MEHKIPTLYSNIDEAMLDIDIYGRKVLSPHLSIPELRDRLFEDFKRSKPLPTLTSKRYELSRLVSEDYKILYTKELELRVNEELMNLRENNSSKKAFNFNFDNLEPIATNIKTMFTYESRTRDVDRENILAKYDLTSGEEFQRGIAETEKIFNSVVEDSSLVKTDEEIELMGQEEPIQVLDFTEDTIDSDIPVLDFTNINDEDDEDDEYPDFDDEGFDDNSEAASVGNSEDDSDDEYPDFDDEDDEYPDFDDEDSEESSEDNLEDSDDDDEYPDFDDEDDEYPDFDDETTSENDITVEVSSTTSQMTVDEDFSNFDMEFEEEKLNIPKTPAELNIIKPVEEKIDRSAEPTDLRQFLRKYPRSSMEFVSKYFTKKQINDALRQGKIIKRGNTLRLP